MQAFTSAWDGTTGRLAITCSCIALLVLFLRILLFRVGLAAGHSLPWLAGRKAQYALMLAVGLGSTAFNLDSGLMGLVTSVAILVGVVVGWSRRSALHVAIASLLLLHLTIPFFLLPHLVTMLPSRGHTWHSSYKGQHMVAVASPLQCQAIYIYHEHVNLQLDTATTMHTTRHRQYSSGVAIQDVSEATSNCTHIIVSIGARTRLQARWHGDDIAWNSISLLGPASTLRNSEVHCVIPSHRLPSTSSASQLQAACLQLAPDISIENTRFVFHDAPPCRPGAHLCNASPLLPTVMNVTRLNSCSQFTAELSRLWVSRREAGVPLPVRCAVAPLTAASLTLPLLIAHGDLPAGVMVDMPWDLRLLRYIHDLWRVVTATTRRLWGPLVKSASAFLDHMRHDVACLLRSSRTALHYARRCLLGLLCHSCVLPADWCLQSARLYKRDHAYQLGHRMAGYVFRTFATCATCLRRACVAATSAWGVVRAAAQFLLSPIWHGLSALFVIFMRVVSDSVLTPYGTLLCHSAYKGVVWILSAVGSGLCRTADFVRHLVKQLPRLSLTLLRSSAAVAGWFLHQYYATSFFTHLLLCVLQTCALLVRKQSFRKPYPRRRPHPTASLPHRGAHLLLRTLMPTTLPTRLRQYKVIHAAWCLAHPTQMDRQNTFRYVRVHFELFILLVGLSVLPFTTWLYKTTLLVILPWMSSQAFLAFLVRASPPSRWQVTALSLVHAFAAILVQHTVSGPFYIMLREAVTMLELFVVGCAVVWLWPRSTAQMSSDADAAAFGRASDVSEACSSSSTTNVSSSDHQISGGGVKSSAAM